MTSIAFGVPAESLDLISRVADRYQTLEIAAGNRGLNRRDRSHIVMDLCANQNSSTPVDLEALLEADDFEFSHDAFGIARHLNHETGELEDCFLPRFLRKA